MAQRKKSFMKWRSECPISSGLDILGDKWSLLIVRDLIVYGTRTYSEFSQSAERISTNILANRLKLLTTLGVIERVDADRVAWNNAFQLTKSGKELRKVLEELGSWSHTNLKELHPTMVGME